MPTLVYLRALHSLCIVVTVICVYIISSKTTVPQTSIAEDNSLARKVWDSSQTNGFGYVMANLYTDQMSGSMVNMASLQCWASSVGPEVRLVEPFLRRSQFGVNLHATYNRTIRREVKPHDDNSVTLSDIVDLLEWEEFAKENEWFPQTKWASFIKDAPRQLILVHKVINHINPTNFYTSSALFSKHFGFEIVRNVSLINQTYSKEEFKKQVYADYSPRKVVVLFSLWGGFLPKTNELRPGVQLSDYPNCIRGLIPPVSNLPPSAGIIQDANKYSAKYLDQGNGYISVMVRIEHLILRYELLEKTKELILSRTTKCFHNLHKELTKLKKTHNTEKIFLTLDCRDSGSHAFMNAKKSLIATTAVDTLFPMLYGNSTTLDEWDKSFDNVVTHNAPGYVAMLQKHLAAKGVCLLTVGGGSFQSNTRLLHSSYHPNMPECTRLVSEC